MWEELLTRIVQENGFDCKVVKDDSLYKPMIYRPKTNSIHFNTGQVLGVSGRFGYLLQDTFKCIAYHELGHYMDFKEKPELKNLFNDTYYKANKFELESRAVELGRTLIKENRLLEIYDVLNKARIDSISK
ncbi:hypothetical protein D3C74_374890 [compost metagenome]